MRFKDFTILIKRFDWPLFVLMIFLAIIGFIVQYSLTLNTEALGAFILKKQAIAFFIGLILFFLISFSDFRSWRSYGYVLYILGIVFLLGVLFFGQTLRGTKGWFVFGPFSFQAVEFFKLILVVVLARYWSKVVEKRADRKKIKIRDVVLSGFLVLIPIGLVVLQPDLGSALLLFILWFILFLVIDSQLRHILGLCFLLLLVIASSWLFYLKPYQKERVLTFLNPERDPLGQGYQITQSIVAVGSGQIFGRGLGLGPQSQLRFLPDASTDFVFSVIAEEFGLLGVFLLIGLYLALFYRLIKILKYSYDDFSAFLAAGIVILLFSQIFINIGMNIGLVPVAGIPLPLISYGGSFLVMTLAAMGIVQSVAIHGAEAKEYKI